MTETTDTPQPEDDASDQAAFVFETSDEEKQLLAVVLEREETEKKTADLRLEYVRLQMAPHILYCATVIKTDEGYRCLLDEDTEDFGETVSADGDTPSEACSNFDHLWVYGR